MFFYLLIALAACEEMLVTKEYVDYLKRHVSWEVMDYEDNPFRGFTVQEAHEFLGGFEYPGMETNDGDLNDETDQAPEKADWRELCPSCMKVRNQGNCGSCWAFATAGMLGDRCCIKGQAKCSGSETPILLSTQELVGCVKYGCRGSWPTWALDYVATVKGLVDEKCVPYTARDGACPKACTVTSEKWVHKCGCKTPYKKVAGNAAMIEALVTGPITVAFWVCNSFFNYKNGIYKCDCAANGVGLHAVTAVGFDNTGGACKKWIVRNSWGESWGNKGYFEIGCAECGMNGKYPEGNTVCDVAY